MAKLSIERVLHVGMKHKHSATDWQVALDPEFTMLIDESLKDSDNLLEWHTPLRKIDDQDKMYSDEDIIYARIRLWFKNESTGWFVLNDNQNYQKVIITEDGKYDIHTDTEKLNMQ